MILAYFTRRAHQTGNHAVCVILMMCCLTAINRFVKRKVLTMTEYNLKPCPFCGGDVCFDNAYSYFRDNMIYCNGCDMVFTLDDCSASDDDIARAWNRRGENG